MPKMDHYALRVGEAGAERLSLLNQDCNPYTLSFIHKSANL